MNDLQRIEEIDKLLSQLKQYKKDVKKRWTMNNRAMGQMSEKQYQKMNADIAHHSMAIDKLSHGIHATCVNLSFADIRDRSDYEPITYEPSGWQTYEFQPPLPNDYKD